MAERQDSRDEYEKIALKTVSDRGKDEEEKLGKCADRKQGIEETNDILPSCCEQNENTTGESNTS